MATCAYFWLLPPPSGVQNGSNVLGATSILAFVSELDALLSSLYFRQAAAQQLFFLCHSRQGLMLHEVLGDNKLIWFKENRKKDLGKVSNRQLCNRPFSENT